MIMVLEVGLEPTKLTQRIYSPPHLAALETALPISDWRFLI